MKIFILPTSYPDEESPQRNIFIYEQAKELAHRNHEIIILHIKKLPSKKVFSTFKKNEIKKTDDGFAIRYTIEQKTFLENKFHKCNGVLFTKKAIRLYDYVENLHGKPDIIYAHFSCWAGYAGAIISKSRKVPVAVMEHYGGLLQPKIPRSIKKCVDFTCNHANVFACVSSNLKKNVEKIYSCKKKIVVIPNMIDRQFKYIPVQETDNFIFTSIGNLNKGKDFTRLIEAFCLAFERNDKVILRIGGGGPEFKTLHKQIDEAGRTSQILLLGRLNREQTLLEYANCNAFVLASKFETFGMVYREALITGRPIVTTDHGGFAPESWHEEYGYKVPIKDTKALSLAMKNLYVNYKLFDGTKISSLCLEECSPDLIGNRIEQMLFEAIKMNK